MNDPSAAAQILQELRLEKVQSSLLEDAARAFTNGGTPTRHEEASSAYRAPVYEVRDRSGAGWRGAVILDSDGDPWLVFAERHDHFHAAASKALKRDKGELEKTGRTKGAAAYYEPTKLDYDVRNHEEGRLRSLEFQRDLITLLHVGLREANATGSVATARTPDSREPGFEHPIEYTIEVTHDEPAETAEDANLSTSTVTLTLPTGTGSFRGYEMLVSSGSLYIQPDRNYHEAVYTQRNALRLDLCVTHAKLTQLLSDPGIDETNFPPSATPPDRLHWVHSPQHIEGIVTGSAVQSLCGGWFVPVENESADLPVCSGCEAIRPLAQQMLDELRLRTQS